MGIDDIAPDDGDNPSFSESTTVGELKSKYGDACVIRALSYMESLSDAQESYKESADSQRMKEGYDKAGVADGDGDKLDKATNKWEEKMRDAGLGLDGDNDEG